MTDHDLHPEPLSTAGAARRDEILVALRGEVVRTASRRRVRRRIAAGAVVIAPVLLVALWAARSNSSSGPSPQRWLPGEVASAHRWTTLASDPTAASRLTLTSRTDWTGVIVGDDELLLELEEAGRPAGLIRMNGRAWISGLDPAQPQRGT